VQKLLPYADLQNKKQPLYTPLFVVIEGLPTNGG
jgi:hypothetical protein